MASAVKASSIQPISVLLLLFLSLPNPNSVFTIEVEHQSEDVGGHHPTLDHLVHASFLRDQGVVAREGPLKEEAVATAAAVVRHCCLVNHR
nr:hypothetical protein CFP56_12824 [Quercus suber]